VTGLTEEDHVMMRPITLFTGQRADAGMDRLVGAPEALAFGRSRLFEVPTGAFDAAFSRPKP
jgi:hypothetical protein